jgi:hypothetical protein
MADFLWQWLKATYDPTALWASISTILITYGAWSIAERVYPAERGQPLSLAIFNLWAGLVYILLTRIGAFVGGSIAAFIIAQLWGGPLICWDLQAAAASVPGWLAYAALVPLAFLPLLTFDFFYYWFHRFQHEWPWFWHVHRLHHTDRADVTTSSRHHWLEDFFRAILIVVPMTLLLQAQARGGRLPDRHHRPMGVVHSLEHQAANGTLDRRVRRPAVSPHPSLDRAAASRQELRNDHHVVGPDFRDQVSRDGRVSRNRRGRSGVPASAKPQTTGVARRYGKPVVVPVPQALEAALRRAG